MASHTNAETNMEDCTKATFQVIWRISECPELEGVRAMTIGSMALCRWKAQSVPEPHSLKFVDTLLSVEPLQRAPGIDFKHEDLRFEVRKALVRRFPQEFNDSTYLSGDQRDWHPGAVLSQRPSSVGTLVQVDSGCPSSRPQISPIRFQNRSDHLLHMRDSRPGSSATDRQ
ncbi:hypothetical protein BDV19DRAFT_391216 [Aspergillus venezuelensis]